MIGKRARRRASRFLLSSLLMAASAAVFAADPSSGTITPTGQSVTWRGTATAGGCAGEDDTAIEGLNSETFTLNVGGTKADWAGKMIRIDIGWSLPTNDYDLYVHKDSNAGMLVGNSGAGIPATSEACAIDPSRTGTGVYTVHVIYFAVAPNLDQYQGTATVASRLADGSRPAVYLKSGISFSKNTTVKAPVAEADGEPSSRCDKLGNYYIAGIRGVPAGVDLWYFDLNPNSPTFDPFMRNPIYRGQPDSWTGDESMSVGADGGGDVDIAVGFDPLGGGPVLAFSSLVAANISTGVSRDMGKSWTFNPLGNVTGGVPVDDRQWLEFYGNNVVYLLYRTLQPAITQIQRSNDGGLTWGVAQTAGQIGQVGGVDVDQHDGTVVLAGSEGKVAVGVPLTPGGEPTSYTVYDVVSNPFGIQNIFVVPKIADDGTIYVTYSNGYNVYLKHSSDKGKTWSDPVRVNDGADTACAVLPHLETGPTPGTVAVVWFGSSDTWNNPAANWKVFMAQSSNADSGMPVFRQAPVSDHFIHAGVISTGGTLGSENRNLLDYFQVCFDPQGAAVIGWTDDHNDYDGFTYVARQVSGATVYKKKLKEQVEGVALPPAQPYSSDGSHVVDFAGDVAKGLLVVTPEETALDVRSIKYGSETGADGLLYVTAQMKVTNLSKIGPDMTWRMCFSANAADAGLNATGAYSNGISDRGDMFYLRASTDATGANFYRWGTVVRNRDGSLTYTERGSATGAFDASTNTVTAKVPVRDLNRFATRTIGSGTVLSGLRGQAFTTRSNVIIRDSTRGGTEVIIK